MKCNEIMQDCGVASVWTSITHWENVTDALGWAFSPVESWFLLWICCYCVLLFGQCELKPIKAWVFWIILTSGFADITVNRLQTPGSERLSQWPQIERYFYTYMSFNPSRISVSTSTWFKKNLFFFLRVEAQQGPKVKGQTREFLSAPQFVSSPLEKWPQPHEVADGGGERTEYHTQCY